MRDPSSPEVRRPEADYSRLVLEHTVIGEGAVDFPAIFRTLKREADFDGWISLEAGGTRGEDGIRQGIDYVKQTWDAV